MLCGKYRIFTEMFYFDLTFLKGEMYCTGGIPHISKFLYFTGDKIYQCHFRWPELNTVNNDIMDEFTDFWIKNKTYEDVYDDEFLKIVDGKLINNKSLKYDSEYLMVHTCGDYGFSTNQGDYYCHAKITTC